MGLRTTTSITCSARQAPSVFLVRVISPWSASIYSVAHQFGLFRCCDDRTRTWHPRMRESNLSLQLPESFSLLSHSFCSRRTRMRRWVKIRTFLMLSFYLNNLLYSASEFYSFSFVTLIEKIIYDRTFVNTIHISLNSYPFTNIMSL